MYAIFSVFISKLQCSKQNTLNKIYAHHFTAKYTNKYKYILNSNSIVNY